MSGDSLTINQAALNLRDARTVWAQRQTEAKSARDAESAAFEAVTAAEGKLSEAIKRFIEGDAQ